MPGPGEPLNPSTLETERRANLGYLIRPVWSTEWAPTQPTFIVRPYLRNNLQPRKVPGPASWHLRWGKLHAHCWHSFCRLCVCTLGFCSYRSSSMAVNMACTFSVAFWSSSISPREVGAAFCRDPCACVAWKSRVRIPSVSWCNRWFLGDVRFTKWIIWEKGRKFLIPQQLIRW